MALSLFSRHYRVTKEGVSCFMVFLVDEIIAEITEGWLVHFQNLITELAKPEFQTKYPDLLESLFRELTEEPIPMTTANTKARWLLYMRPDVFQFLFPDVNEPRMVDIAFEGSQILGLSGVTPQGLNFLSYQAIDEEWIHLDLENPNVGEIQETYHLLREHVTTLEGRVEDDPHIPLNTEDIGSPYFFDENLYCKLDYQTYLGPGLGSLLGRTFILPYSIDATTRPYIDNFILVNDQLTHASQKRTYDLDPRAPLYSQTIDQWLDKYGELVYWSQ